MKQLISLGLAAFLVIGGQLYYYKTGYQAMTQKISEEEQRLVQIEGQLEALKNNPKLLEQLEARQQTLEEERQAIRGRVPSVTSSAEAFLKMKALLDSDDFFNVKVEVIGEESLEGELLQKTYQMSYISTYHRSRAFVQNLNRQYEVAQIKSFHISNEVQRQEADLKTHFGEAFKEVVLTELEVSSFVRLEGEKEQALLSPMRLGEDVFKAFEGDEVAP